MYRYEANACREVRRVPIGPGRWPGPRRQARWAGRGSGAQGWHLAPILTDKKPDDLVVTMPGGSVLRLSNWRRAAFLPARARARLSTRFRVHDLRHTAASLMIQAGYPPKMLQEIMGRAIITTTLDLYGHLYPGDMDRYADRLDSAAEDASKAKTRPDDDDDQAAE